MGGYFHVDEAIEVAERHPNLVLETSAMPYPAKIREAVERLGAGARALRERRPGLLAPDRGREGSARGARPGVGAPRSRREHGSGSWTPSSDRRLAHVSPTTALDLAALDAAGIDLAVVCAAPSARARLRARERPRRRGGQTAHPARCRTRPHRPARSERRRRGRAALEAWACTGSSCIRGRTRSGSPTLPSTR